MRDSSTALGMTGEKGSGVVFASETNAIAMDSRYKSNSAQIGA